MRSVFNWNVKQLFVYVTAEYETEANTLNQVVVWDQIISHPSQAWIRSSSVANKAGLFAFHRSTTSNYTLTVRTTDGTGSGWAAATSGCGSACPAGIWAWGCASV